MGEWSPWHLLIVAVIFVLLFGSKKLPDAARSVGRSLRIFKAEVSQLREDPPAVTDGAAAWPSTPSASSAAPVPSTAPVTPPPVTDQPPSQT